MAHWLKGFVDEATAPPPAEEPRLQPLGHTTRELICQLENAKAQPQTAVVKRYIAEAKRRLALNSRWVGK